MKNILILFALIMCTISLQAQDNTEREIKKETKYLAEIYELNDAQTERLKTIISHKYASLANLESLNITDEPTYRAKRRNIYKGTESSIKLLIDRDQLALYEKEQRRRRLVHAKKMEKLRKKGADKEDILDAEWGIKD